MLSRYDGSLSRRYRTSAGFFDLPCGMAVPPSFGRRDALGLSQSLRRPSVLKALRQRQPGAAPQDWISSEPRAKGAIQLPIHHEPTMNRHFKAIELHRQLAWGLAPG
jgi:hypothetical protein